MVKKIDDILDDPAIADPLTALRYVKTMFEDKDISLKEYEELSNDIVESINVDELAQKVDNKRRAEQIVNHLKQLVSIAVAAAK